MDFSGFHPYVYYATRYPFAKGQASKDRICYASSLYLISEGKGIIRSGGRTHIAVPGSLVYMPAGQQHDWIADNEDPMVHVCCYFDWMYVDRHASYSYASMIVYDAAQVNPELIGPAFPHSIPEHVNVGKIRVWTDWFEKFYTANEYTNERTYFRSVIVQGHFQHFIKYYLTFVLQEEHIPDPRMTRLMERLEQDLIRGSLKSWESYYNELGISRGYFFELFKNATGLSPVQYVNHYLISRAKDELRFSDLTVTSIAEKLRFSSVHYFSKLFRQLTGVTPLEFRNSEWPD